MGLRINTNVEAFNSHRNLSGTTMKISKAMEKLSSGLRINRAADDAAGLGISELMRGQIRGLAQAQRNAQDGISFVQTAEGSMRELRSMFHRVRELAVQYLNGVNGPGALNAITTEVGQLSAEISRMIGAANFNGTALLSMTAGALTTLQVGPNSVAADQLGVSLENAFLIFQGGGGVLDPWITGGAPNITAIDTAITDLANARGRLGAVQNRLEYTINSLGIYQENLMAAESRKVKKTNSDTKSSTK